MKNIAIGRDLLCGRHSLNLTPYLFFAPITILIHPLNEGLLSNPRDFFLWSSLSTLTYFSLLVSVKTLQLILIKKENFSPWPVWIIFAIGASLGAMRGFLNYELSVYLNLTMLGPASQSSRIFSGAFAWLILTPGFALISNSVELAKIRRLAVMESLVIEESIKLSNEENLSYVKDAARKAIENDLSDLLLEVRAQINQAQKETLENQYLKIAAVLTSASEKLIRPMSHKLMSEQRLTFPAPRLWDAFLIALKAPQLPIVPILIMTNIAAISVVSAEVTSVHYLLSLCLILSALVWISVLGITKYAAIYRQMGIAALLFGTLVIVIANYLLIEVLFTVQFNFMQPQRLFLNFFWFLSTFMVTSFLSHLYRNESSIEAFVQQMVDSKKIDQMLVQEETTRVKHDIARYLHGNLQSRMMSLGLTIQMVHDKNQSTLDEVLTIAQSLLNSPFSQYLSIEDRTLVDEVAFNCAKWEGLLSVRTQIADLDSKLSYIQKRAIGTVLEEALANAMRHGFAKEIDVNIYQSASGITIEVIDDGIGPRNNGPGLGSRLYDSIATKGWSLQHRFDGEGTVLELNL
jgi:signal transduction histidine kinase